MQSIFFQIETILVVYLFFKMLRYFQLSDRNADHFVTKMRQTKYI